MRTGLVRFGLCIALTFGLFAPWALAQPLTADIYQDFKVDVKDLWMFADGWLQPGGPADLDESGTVDAADFAILAAEWGQATPVDIVINEIHTDPVPKTELVEFVELYNRGDDPVDMSGWYFSDGVAYTFPPGATIAPHGFVVITENAQHFQAKYGFAADGVFEGRLDNDGERVCLRNRSGLIVDEVTYKLGFPWPTVGDPPGPSMELIHPALDNDLGGNWRPAVATAASQQVVLEAQQVWRCFKGTEYPAGSVDAWRAESFNDDPGTTAWFERPAPVGYGETWIPQPLTDMRYNYSTVYLRKAFYVDDPGAFGGLVLKARCDDGFVAWINGTYVASDNVSGQNLSYYATANSAIEQTDFRDFVLPHPRGYLRAGWNVIAVHLLNSDRDNSSDCFWDARLIASTGGGGAQTPGAPNNSLASNAPPKMRQVDHNPGNPGANQTVTITAKITDEDGVQSVVLRYQIVEPGDYFYKLDARYETDWIETPMLDDGTGADRKAGDDVYTAAIPADVQVHRRLIRYRIYATDGKGATVRGPCMDDPCPNFAYFVYDGVPAWTGAVRPGSTPPVTYTPDVLTSVPVYHFLSKHDDIMHAVWIDQYPGSDYPWWGTLVYDGKVYDHVRYRMRGGVWRYAMGKNMWKFDFNRGHYFQARDDYGRKYDTTWDKLNFSACIQQGDYLHRGEQGMFEALSFKLFNLMGVPAPKTHWLHFRVIDDAAETGPTQYDGDFWGLYMVIEQMDGRFLDEHGLPDGNLYKIEGHNAQMPPNNQGRTGVTNGSDYAAFRAVLYGSPDPLLAWWRQNVNLESYYGYRCVVEGVHHGDIGYGKNYFYYLHPETGIWTMLPWDVDLTWANNMFGNGEDPFKNEGAIFTHSQLRLEYQNRLREFHDLLYNPEQMNRLIDEHANIIDSPTNGPTIVDADRALWDYNPIMTTTGYPYKVNSSKAGQGRFYQQAATKDFRGMCQIMKDYVTGYRQFNSYYEDPAIPETPILTYTGTMGFPANDLTFHTTPFADPQGNDTFAAMSWRLAEVAPAGPDHPGKYEIETLWQSDPNTSTGFVEEITIPAGVVEIGRTYRVRVKMKDTSGRWSHWSAPIEFTVGDPLPNPVLQNLHITEIMYHPAPGWPYDKEEYEFLELKNSGDTTIDLSGVQFDKGIRHTFHSGASVPPGAYLILARNLDAFAHRYPDLDPQAQVFGPYDGKLDNSGEFLRLVDYNHGVIAHFEYKDGWYDITDGEGFSLTLRELPDAADPAAVPVDGLVAHWRFDEESGTVTASETGQYHAQLVNMDNSAWVVGRFGNALRFDGANDYLVTQGFRGITSGARTVAAWIKTTTHKAADIVSWGSTASGGKWLLQIQNTFATPGTLCLDVGGGYLVGSTVLWDGAWHHVAAVLPDDGTADVSEARLYVDGRLETPLAVAPRAVTTSSSTDLKIGIFKDGNLRYFNGLIDNVCLYNRALSGEEIDQMVNPTSGYSRKESWRPSVFAGGSPGYDDSGLLPPPGSVVINELLAHSHDVAPDWIELYNTTDQPIHLGGWFLSDSDADDANRMKYEIAKGTIIGPYDYLVFYEDVHFGASATGPGIRHIPFALSKGGERARLQSSSNGVLTGYIVEETFGASQTDVTFGRYEKSTLSSGYDFVPLEAPTPGSANSPPWIGAVIITEIMYRPGSDNAGGEFLELHNVTNVPVLLQSMASRQVSEDPADVVWEPVPWQFTEGIKYSFPPETVIPARGYLIVAENPAAFNAWYGPLGVPVLGPFEDGTKLDNAGERVTLSYPGDQEWGQERYWIRVDSVEYNDAAPWPTAADGTGASLQHRHPDGPTPADFYGNDPANWTAADPTPGE